MDEGEEAEIILYKAQSNYLSDDKTIQLFMCFMCNIIEPFFEVY